MNDFEIHFNPQTAAVEHGMLTPSQIVGRINCALRAVDEGWVEGEVQGYRGPARSGHHYFDIADEDKSIPVIVWRGRWAHASRELPEPLRNGQLVQCHYVKADMFAHGGKVSLHADRIRLTGEGELLRRRQEVLARLQAEGFCDPSRRRPLPWLPRNIAVIAGRDSDALADVTKAILDRWPLATVTPYPAAVQGTAAVGSIIDALAAAQAASQVDVIVLARGGGSVQDLAPFDDERLCKAIVACPVPVVVSIGHTPNKPNVYAVADGSADVPAKVAELVVPSFSEVTAELDRSAAAFRRAASRVSDRRAQFDEAAGRLQTPQNRLESFRAHLDEHRRHAARVRQRLTRLSEDLEARTVRLSDARLPEPEMLDLPAAAIRDHARRFFTQRLMGLATVAAALSANRQLADAGRLTEARQQLYAAYRIASRQFAAHMERCEHAAGALHGSASRQLDRHEHLLDRRERLRAAERALSSALSSLHAESRALASHDWQKRGFAAVRSADGQIRSRAGFFQPGDIAVIQFEDGSLQVTVNDMERQ